MKKRLITLCLLLLMLFGINEVDALMMSTDEIPASSYIIGTSLYTREAEELTGYRGYLTTDVISTASEYNGFSIGNGEYGDFLELMYLMVPVVGDYTEESQILYVNAFGEVVYAISGESYFETEDEDVSVSAEFEIDSINGVRLIDAPSLDVSYDETTGYYLSFSKVNQVGNLFASLNSNTKVTMEIYEVSDFNSLEFIDYTVNVNDMNGIKKIKSINYNPTVDSEKDDVLAVGYYNIPVGQTKVYLTRALYDIDDENTGNELESLWGIKVISSGLEVKLDVVDGEYLITSNFGSQEVDEKVSNYSEPVAYSVISNDNSFSEFLEIQDNLSLTTAVDKKYDYFKERYEKLNLLDIFYHNNNYIVSSEKIFSNNSNYVEQTEGNMSEEYVFYFNGTKNDVIGDHYLFAQEFNYCPGIIDDNKKEICIPFTLFADSGGYVKLPGNENYLVEE